MPHPWSNLELRMISYFARLNGSQLVLWSCLAWYVAVVCLYFDASPVLWISSLGISVLIGIVLNLATRQPSQKRDRWVTFRLFLIPFCVSSYSALIKGKGFILLFPPNPRQLLIGFSAGAGVVILRFLCRLIASPEKAAASGAKPGPTVA
jgi:hypothetical protein